MTKTAALPPSEARIWNALKPLLKHGAPLDYEKVAQATGVKRSTVSCRLSRLRTQYGLPIPLQPVNPDQKRKTEKNCPKCGAVLELAVSGHWCPECAWDEELDGWDCKKGGESCSSMER